MDKPVMLKTNKTTKKYEFFDSDWAIFISILAFLYIIIFI
jgi:hypothetical protein